MSRPDTMRDPRFAPILLQIERVLAAADALAASRAVTLTDSSVRSVLVRAINDAKGKAAKAAGSDTAEKDRILADMVGQLATLRATLVDETVRPDGSVERRPMSVADWVAALDAIKDSCAVRTGSEPGSRGYLEFLRDFLKRVPPGQ